MAYNPFEIWNDIGDRVAIEEAARRAALSPARRLAEDVGSAALFVSLPVAGVAVTVVPWAIGAWVIGRSVWRLFR